MKNKALEAFGDKLDKIIQEVREGSKDISYAEIAGLLQYQIYMLNKELDDG